MQRTRAGAPPRPFRFSRFATLLTLLAVTVAGCDSILPSGSSGDGGTVPISDLPRALTPSEVEALNASNAFGFDLLRDIFAEDPDESHFLSPLSASMALGMVLNGAGGETFEQMRATLRFEGLEEDEVNAAYRGLIELLSDLDPSVSFQIANSVWHRIGTDPAPDFVTTVEEFFGGAVRAADFSDPATPGVINGWVEEHTEGLIEEIVPDPIPGTIVAYLLNAIYFQGDWTHPFDPDDTHDGPFYLVDGTTETVQFMSRQGDFRYGSSPDVEVADLPYGGGAYAMTVVLPRSDVPLGEVIAEMDEEAWAALVDGLSAADENHRLLLPRFTLEWDRNLNETLEALGMPIAFTGAADFGRMFPGGGVFISEVVQKSFVRVDEEGTEAAAVTSVAMTDSVPPTFAANRPFLFAIRERLSGTILFVGAVVEAPVE